jgi:hypothetical protein
MANRKKKAIARAVGWASTQLRVWASFLYAQQSFRRLLERDGMWLAFLDNAWGF